MAEIARPLHRLDTLQAWAGRKLTPGRILILLVSALVIIMTVVPVAIVVINGFRDAPLGASVTGIEGQKGTWTLDGVEAIFTEPGLADVIWTSTWLSFVRSLLAVSLAVLIAWLLARTDTPWRDKLELLLILSFLFPALGKLLGWTILASERTGYLNQVIREIPGFGGVRGPLNIYTAEGIIFVSVLGWTSILVLFLLPAFRAMDASLEESARVSGASTRAQIWRISVPLLRPAILAVAVLALVRMFSSFETELFLGTPAGIEVFTTKIYEGLVDRTPPEYSTSFSLVLVLLSITLVLVALNWLFIGSRQYTTVSGRSYSARPMRLGRWRWASFLLIAGFLFVSTILPVAVMIQASFMKISGYEVLSGNSYTLRNWEWVLSFRPAVDALKNTLILSLSAATIGAFFYAIIAYIITRTKFGGRKLLDLAIWVPWAVPLLVLGFGVLWSVTLTPLKVLYGSLGLLILAHIVRGIPAETRILTSNLVQIGGELEDSARVHGASWLTMFRRVMLPLIKNGLVTVWILGFTVAFYDLALVAMLAGPGSQVYPTLFLSLWRVGEVERGAAVGLIMTIIIFVAVLVIRRITRAGLQAEGIR